jgi:hypothetical protein
VTDEPPSDAALAAGQEQDEARKAAREAEPLREWCVDRGKTDGVVQVVAHRVFDDTDSYFSLFTTVPSVRRVRFIVFRYGCEDVVAMFRSDDVRAVYEINAEPI